MGNIPDPATVYARLDQMKARYNKLLNEWERYERDLGEVVRDADKLRLPLWEIAERTGRHRNFVSNWTSVRRRPLNAPDRASR